MQDTDNCTPEEMMIIATARRFSNRSTSLVGTGYPSIAASLARVLHAPEIILIYESGIIGPKPSIAPLSVADTELAETADFVVSLPEMFTYWLQGGRIEMGFIGAAQIDRFGNINSTVVGDYRSPKIRMPGAGIVPEVLAFAEEVVIVLRHTPGAFASRLDFITSVGHRTAAGTREQLGMRGKGPTSVITDLGILQPLKETGELVLVSRHPGVTVDQILAATGWPLKVARDLEETWPASHEELSTLRELNLRTKLAQDALQAAIA